MILLKTTRVLDDKTLHSGKVHIAVDLGYEDVLVTLSDCEHETCFHCIAGYVSRYQIALGMEW